MPNRMKPNVLLSDDEAMDIALKVENIVCERLEEKAKKKGTDFCPMTDSNPGIRAVVDALIRNYL